MIQLSPKLKILIVLSCFIIAALIAVVVGVTVKQKLDVVKVQTISFTSANQKMLVGDRTEINVSIDPSNAKDKRIRFRSSDSLVVVIESVGQSSVVVRAVGLGEADIIVESVKNKKITDKLHIEVSDNVALEVEAPAGVTSIVGTENSVPLVLVPSSANAQKIDVLSFNADMIEYAYISVVDGVPNLIYKAKSAGSGQIVVSVKAQLESSDVVVLTKLIEVSATDPKLAKFGFVAASSRLETFEERDNKFMLSDGKIYIRFSAQNENETSDYAVLPSVLKLVYNSDILSVSIENDMLVVEAVDANYTTTALNVMFNNETLSFTFVNVAIPEYFASADCRIDGATTSGGKYTLENGKNYKLVVSDTVAKLIENGFAHIELVGIYEAFELVDNYILIAKAETGQNIQVGFELKIDYWDRSVLPLQCNLDIEVVEAGYDER